MNYVFEEVAAGHLPLKSNMNRIMLHPKIQIKKIVICIKCSFATILTKGRKKCPACDGYYNL